MADVASVEHTEGRTPLRPALGFVSVLAIVLGLLGLGRAQVAQEKPATSSYARGAFWHAVDARGEILTVEDGTSGVLIAPGQRLHFGDEKDDQRVIETVRVAAARMDEGSPIDLRVRERDRSATILRLTPSYGFGLVFLREQDGQLQQKGQQRNDQDFAGPRFKPVELSVLFDGPRLQAQVNRDTVLTTDGIEDTGGAISVATSSGFLRVVRLEISGRVGNTPFTVVDELRNLPRASILRSSLRGVAKGLLALAALAVLLLGCCGTRPTRAAFLSALLRAATLPALACALAIFQGDKSRVPPVALLLLLGAPSLGAALFRLRPFLDRAPEGAARVPAWLGPIAFACMAVIAGLAGFEHRTAQLQPLREQLRRAAAPDPDPIVLPAARLTAATSTFSRTQFRDFDLEGTVALMPGAIVEARVRAQSGEGIALMLSADPAVATRFARVEEDGFTLIGSGSGAVPVRVASKLRIEGRGKTVRAFFGGNEVARTTEDLYPRGGVSMQTLTGTAEMDDVTVTAVAAPPPDAELLGERGAAAAAPAVYGLALAVLLALLLRGSLLLGPVGLALGAIALVPWTLALRADVPGEAVPATPALLAAATTTLVLFFAAMTRVRAAGVLRFYGAFVVALGAGAVVFVHVTQRHWPADVKRMNSFTPVEWSGERIEPHLLHACHPLIRRWSTWVVDHKLRKRVHALQKPENTRRVMFLGTSSTYGYGTKEAYGQMLEERFKNGSKTVAEPFRRPVEVLIGAWSGSTGIRQFHFLKNVGVAFEPDVVCLSLYYNDAPTLTQFDEPAYYDRISAPGYERSLIDDLRTRASITAGESLFERGNRCFVDQVGEPPRWDAESTPPMRYEGVLRRFAELCKQRAIRLVFMKEPVAADKPRLWKNEFYATMDRVGAEYGIPVVDPTPALKAAGGGALFMDDVHPFDAGHVVIADVLEPVLRKELEALEGK